MPDTMTLFYIVAGVCLLGIGLVLWLLKKDASALNLGLSDQLEDPLDKISITDSINTDKVNVVELSSAADFAKSLEEDKPKPKKKFSLDFLKNIKLGKKKKKDDDLGNIPDAFSKQPGKPNKKFSLDFLKKIKFGKKKVNPEDEAVPEPTTFPSLKDHLENEQNKTEPAGAMPLSENLESKQPTLSIAEEEKIGKEVDITAQLDEMKEKYERLDAIFKEKSQELEKVSTSLTNEVKNRKEFNKVKDILEKEIKDIKDRNKDLHNELSDSSAQSVQHKKRVSQMEAKVTNLQKNIIDKEDMMVEMQKKVDALPDEEVQKDESPAEETSVPTTPLGEAVIEDEKAQTEEADVAAVEISPEEAVEIAKEPEVETPPAEEATPEPEAPKEKDTEPEAAAETPQSEEKTKEESKAELYDAGAFERELGIEVESDKPSRPAEKPAEPEPEVQPESTPEPVPTPDEKTQNRDPDSQTNDETSGKSSEPTQTKEKPAEVEPISLEPIKDKPTPMENQPPQAEEPTIEEPQDSDSGGIQYDVPETADAESPVSQPGSLKIDIGEDEDYKAPDIEGDVVEMDPSEFLKLQPDITEEQNTDKTEDNNQVNEDEEEKE